MADFSALLSPALVEQAERDFLNFIAAHSDSMALAIDERRVIRYCNHRLRALLEYGWHGDLVKEDGSAVLIDDLLPPDPPDLREWHAGAIAHWFQDAPRVLEMHSRRPVKIMTRRGNAYYALIKLVPFELQEHGRRPLLDKPRYHRFGVAFVTLLPRSWTEPPHAEYQQSAPIPADRASGQLADPSTQGRPPFQSDRPARTGPPFPPGRTPSDTR